jgi:hypothetical protein
MELMLAWQKSDGPKPIVTAEDGTTSLPFVTAEQSTGIFTTLHAAAGVGLPFVA